MRASSVFRLVLAIWVGSGSLATASSEILVPKFIPGTNGFYFSETNGPLSGNLPQEIHLPVALFQETNMGFDRRLYESVRKTIKPPMIISFLLVTFIFSSPNTNDPVYSFSEMGQPDELICTGKSVSRRPGSTNQVPLIRVSTVDRRKKDLAADLDLLIGVAPLDDPKDVRYLRRAFHFVYRDGWKED